MRNCAIKAIVMIKLEILSKHLHPTANLHRFFISSTVPSGYKGRLHRPSLARQSPLQTYSNAKSYTGIMSSIFIIGYVRRPYISTGICTDGSDNRATGFIGLPVATALRREGYIVYALARSPEKAKLLAQNEIIPIQGDVKNLSEHIPPTVEIVIDISGLYQGIDDVLKQLKEIGGGRKPTDPKLGFIYTSGMWVSRLGFI